jgi:D-glycero-alpha-D-manno-heptose-7-phosphate kinase
MNSSAITPELEEIYSRSKKAGALGGKVLGAGGGGFCLFWVEEGTREDFLRKFDLGTFVQVKVSNEGSTCIFK